jgi:Rieske [2Fe-2S] domain
MAEDQTQSTGPDLKRGIAASELPDGGKLVGHVGQDAVMLARRGADIFAIGAQCTHYNGPLAEGSWSMTRCDAPGITPALIFARARRFARPP